MQGVVNQIRDGFAEIKQNMAMSSAQAAKGPIPVCQSCLTTTTFLISSAVMLGICLAYTMYR